MVRLFLLGFFCSLGIAAQAESLINYVDKVYHYKLQIPGNWQPMDAKFAAQHGLMAGFSGPQQGAFRPTITVQIHNCPSLEAFHQKCLRDVSSQGVLVSQKSVKFGTLPGHQLVWQVNQGGRTVEYLSAYFVVDGKSYVFNGLCQQSGWKSLAPVLAKAAASLRHTP